MDLVAVKHVALKAAVVLGMGLLGVGCAPRSPERPGVSQRVAADARPVAAPAASLLRPEAPTPKPRPAFAQVLDEEGLAWRPGWNEVIADALDEVGQPLLDDGKVPAGEVSALCPGYFQATREEKKALWALLFSAIARLESGFDPERNFFEPKPLRTLSAGLLQLSYGDESRHRDCPLNPAAANITDPAANLRCGVAILRDQLQARGTLFPPRFYYWSVLTKKRAAIVGDFQRHRAQLPFCR